MKNILLIAIIFSFLFSCNTYKRAEKQIYSGNFDAALDNMVKKYRNGNIKEKDITRWIETFNRAYAKANAQNIDEIYQAQYRVENSEKYRAILYNYQSLQARYDKLKPILPIIVDGQTMPIRAENYSMQLEHSKTKLADALYAEAEQLLNGFTKQDYRMAYDKYQEIAMLIPNYTSIQDKLQLAYNKGLTHVLVTINNDSRSILPRNLHNDLTYFDSKRADLFWQKFHTNPQLSYDYTLELNFRDIRVSPDMLDKSKQAYHREWIDSSRVEKDKSGKEKRIYETVNARCEVTEIRQYKSAEIQAEFLLLDRSGNLISRVSPIASNFNFENLQFIIKGDERALDKKHNRHIREHKNICISFPSDEQMVYDCGMDLKNKFTGFVVDNIANR